MSPTTSTVIVTLEDWPSELVGKLNVCDGDDPPRNRSGTGCFAGFIIGSILSEFLSVKMTENAFKSSWFATFFCLPETGAGNPPRPKLQPPQALPGTGDIQVIQVANILFRIQL